jgi:hypothetical protein
MGIAQERRMRHFQMLCNRGGDAPKSLIRPDILQISVRKQLRFQKTGIIALNKKYDYR